MDEQQAQKSALFSDCSAYSASNTLVVHLCVAGNKSMGIDERV